MNGAYLLYVALRLRFDGSVSCPEKEITMDFNKPNLGPVTPMATPKNAVPIDDAEPGEDWLITDPVIGPSKHRRATPGSPSTIDPLSVATATSLASKLNWTVGKPEG